MDTSKNITKRMELLSQLKSLLKKRENIDNKITELKAEIKSTEDAIAK